MEVRSSYAIRSLLQRVAVFYNSTVKNIRSHSANIPPRGFFRYVSRIHGFCIETPWLVASLEMKSKQRGTAVVFLPRRIFPRAALTAARVFAEWTSSARISGSGWLAEANGLAISGSISKEIWRSCCWSECLWSSGRTCLNLRQFYSVIVQAFEDLSSNICVHCLAYIKRFEISLTIIKRICHYNVSKIWNRLKNVCKNYRIFTAVENINIKHIKEVKDGLVKYRGLLI